MLRRAVTSKVGLVRWMFGALVAAALMPSNGHAQVQLTVPGSHPDIQSAVNACPKNGCDIILVDTVYRIPREIWIEGYINLTIRRSADLERRGIRPRIVYGTAATQASLWTGFAGTSATPTDPERPTGWKAWPLNDGTGVGGAKNTAQWSTSGFQHIGYIVVRKSDYIVLDGIKVDGLQPTYLLTKSIWPETAGGAGKYSVLFGNVGVNLMQAHKVTIRNSEILNCFASIYMNGRNPGGAFGSENPGDLDGSKIVPYAAFGRVGDHVIEKNLLHNNWWAFFNESEWDLGSTIRYNLAYSNYHPTYSAFKGLDTEAANMFGGFMYIKDVVLVPHKIYNNTMYDNSMVLAYGGWRGGIQHYFYNNIVAKPRYQVGSGTNVENSWNDFRNLLRSYSTFLYNNTFEFPATWGGTQNADLELKGPDSIVQGTNRSYCNQAWCSVNDATYRKTIFNNIQVNDWTLERASNTNPKTWVTLTYNGKLDTFRVNQQSFFDSMGLVLGVKGIPTGTDSIRTHQNHYVLGLPFKSTTPGSATFLEPLWDTPKVDSLVEDRGWINSGRDADGSLVDRGAIPRVKGTAQNQIVVNDQTMASIISGTTVKINFGIDAPGMTDLRWEKLDFYPSVSYVMKGGTPGKPTDLPDKSFPNPLRMTVTSGLPLDGQNSFTATLPSAPTDSFARFEITVSGIPVGGTERVTSNIGVWVWRKADYALDVQFLDPVTLLPVTAVRVGQPVKMRVRVQKTSDGSYPTGAAMDSLILSLGSIMLEGLPGASVDTVKSGEVFDPKLPTGQKTYDVFFTRVEAARTIDLNLRATYGSKPVIGSASLRIRSGPPEKALFVTPTRLSANRTAPVVVNQVPSQFEIELRDAFDNPVDDTVVNVELFSNLTALPGWIGGINPTLGGVVARWGATATGPWTQPAGTSKTDSLGYSIAHPFHYVTGTKGSRYLVTARVPGKTFYDTAWIEVGDPLEQIVISPKVEFDTLVRTKMPVQILLSKDGTTAFATSPFAGGTVRLSTKSGSKYLSFYATSAATDTTRIDSVVLVAGKATVWVTVFDMPTTRLEDTLVAEMPEIFAPAPGLSGKVVYRRPPAPPNPLVASATSRDADCDGLVDTLVIQLKASAPGQPSKVSANVRLDSIRIVSGATTTVLASGWSIPVSDSSIVRLIVPAGLRASLPAATVAVHFLLRNPPLDDTLVWTPAVAVTDGIGPRLVGNAIITENFGRPTTPDTLQVTFSEPVNFNTSAGWVLAVYNAGTPVATTTLSVTGLLPVAGGNSYKIVFNGNTGTTVAAGYTVRLLPVATVADLAGNLAGGTECQPGVPVVEQPSPVPVDLVWMRDANGDGRADRLFVRYVKPATRKVRLIDLPDTITVGWGAQTASIPRSALLTIDSLTWEAAVGPFAFGVTTGGSADGSGTAVATRLGAPIWSQAAKDSVAPIALQASLSYAPTSDILTVRYSEAVKFRTVSGAWMVWKSGNGPDANLELGAGTPTEIDPTTIAFPLTPGSSLNPNPGDSTRLPLSGSRIIAANGTEPNSSALSPYTLILGGDRPPRLAWYKDENADGVVDAAYMVFAVPLKTSPTYEFRLGSETRPVDSTNGLVIAADRLTAKVSFVSNPFTQIKTDIRALDSLGTMSSKMGGEGVVAKFPIQDSVPPVILTARMRYSSTSSEPNSRDTLKLVLSEPVVLTGAKTNLIWGMATSNARQLMHREASLVSETELWLFFPAEGGADNPGTGDSVRVAPIDRNGEISDLLGNAPTFTLAKWTPVQAGQRPPQFAMEIYPTPLLLLKPGTEDPIGLGSGPQVTVWIKSANQAEWTEVNGSQIGSRKVGVDPVKGTTGFDGLGVGPKLKLNGPFEATALIYDNLGTFVGLTTVAIDTAMIVSQGLDQGTGTFEVFIDWNGKDAKGKPAASGVYMFRVVAYHDAIDENTGVKGRKMLLNQITKVGVKIPQP